MSPPLAVFLARVSPTFRRLIWQRWYRRLARSVPAEDWTFMNYGLALPAEDQPNLRERDERDRYCIQLYHRAIQPACLAGGDVLEVGCGRGGGASYVARYFAPRQVIGSDISPDALARCLRCLPHTANLSFTIADAEKLPFADSSFDAVINIESSHCYANVTRFFRETARVLRPGGYLLFADIRPAMALPELRQAVISAANWTLLEEEDLTTFVVAALRADNGRKRQLITRTIPASLQSTVVGFSALVGSPMFTGFAERRLLYHRFALQKAR